MEASTNVLSAIIIISLAVFLFGCTAPADNTNGNIAEMKSMVEKRGSLNYMVRYEHTEIGPETIQTSYDTYYKFGNDRLYISESSGVPGASVQGTLYEFKSSDKTKKGCNTLGGPTGESNSPMLFLDEVELMEMEQSGNSVVSAISPQASGDGKAAKCFSIVRGPSASRTDQICYNDYGIPTSMSFVGNNNRMVAQELNIFPTSGTFDITSVIPERCKSITE
jgi:hypothetical protein